MVLPSPGCSSKDIGNLHRFLEGNPSAGKQSRRDRSGEDRLEDPGSFDERWPAGAVEKGMLQAWRSGILGGGLSLTIHTLLLGLALLIAQDQIPPAEYSSTPQDVLRPPELIFRFSLRDRFLFDRNGPLEGPRSPLKSDAAWEFPILHASMLPGVFAGRSKAIYRGTSEAMTAALQWLVRHQNEDGSWSVERFDRHCHGVGCSGAGGARCDDCVTALAVLALSEAGHEAQPDGVSVDSAVLRRRMLCKEAVSKGVSWLSSRRTYYGGCLGARALADRLVHESWCGPLFLGTAGISGELMESQKTPSGGCSDGSWDPGSAGESRVCLVAMNALRLEGHPDPGSLLGTCEGGYR
jgi:hypothetical protein